MMDFRTLRSKCALLALVCLSVLGTVANAAADTITLEWDPSGGSVGYRLHVGTASGSYTQHIDVGPATLYAFSTAVAGQRYCFAVSAYLQSSQLEGPNSGEVCGYSNAPPTLQNPGNRTSTVGQAVTLQLQGSDPASQPLTYSATGLPPGLSVMPSTGFISGTGTTAGTYSVTARASDTVLAASQTFTWVMTAATGGGGTDAIQPTVAIGSPTNNSSYTATSAAIALSGTASDNSGVTQVTWASDRGGSGVATGTTSWSVTSIPLVNGTNAIMVTARDAAGNQATDTLTVTYNASTGGGGGTSTNPVVTITSPTSNTSFTSTSSTVTLRGTATDDQGVSAVGYRNDRGGSGYASGTSSWSANVALQPGTNVISIGAADAQGNQGWDTITVTYSTSTGGGTGGGGSTPPPTGGAPTLRLEPGSGFGVRLYWTDTSWSSVDVYRNGTRVRNTADDGSTTDFVSQRGSYSYKLCAPGSTTVCSNTVNISF